MIQISRFLFFTCLCFTSAYSQSYYFKTGKNFTNYVFETSGPDIQSTISKLNTSTGTFYEIGTSFPFKTTRFSFEFGLSLNELNSIVESPLKSNKYNTEYIGLDNSVIFSILKNKTVLWDAKLGLGIQTLIFGKQEVGGVLHDLKHFSEFNGLFFRQSLGTQIRLAASNQLDFSIGYDYYYMFNVKNNLSQSIYINNNQIKFGVYYLPSKKSKAFNLDSVKKKISLNEISIN